MSLPEHVCPHSITNHHCFGSITTCDLKPSDQYSNPGRCDLTSCPLHHQKPVELNPLSLPKELAQRYTEILVTQGNSGNILSYCVFLLDTHSQDNSHCPKIIGGETKGQRVISLYCKVPNCAECPVFRQSPSKS